MTIKERTRIYEKYDSRCAYCGNIITIKEMQVDHMCSKKHGGTDDVNNLMPSCRRCNHYKRAYDLEGFRSVMKTLGHRIKQNYINKVAIDYGIIVLYEWDGEFYFEWRERI